MTHQQELHYEPANMHIPTEDIRGNDGYTDPSILYWERMTGEQWHYVPGYLEGDDLEYYPPIHMSNPSERVSQIVKQRVHDARYQNAGGYGGPKHERKNSALKSSGITGNFLDLVSRVPLYGRDLITMFSLENDLYGNAMEYPVIARERFPDPSDWIHKAKAELTYYQLHPSELKDRLTAEHRVINLQHSSGPEDDKRKDYARAFVRFYESDYEEPKHDSSSAAAWQYRATALDNLAKYVYGTKRWAAYKKEHDFNFNTHVADDIVKVANEKRNVDGIYSEHVRMNMHIDVEEAVEPVLTQSEMRRHGIDGELRCMVRADGQSWGVVSRRIQNAGTVESSSELSLISYRRGKFDARSSQQLNGDEGSLVLAMDDLDTELEDDVDRSKFEDVKLSWDNGKLVVYRDGAYTKDVAVQYSHQQVESSPEAELGDNYETEVLGAVAVGGTVDNTAGRLNLRAWHRGTRHPGGRHAANGPRQNRSPMRVRPGGRHSSRHLAKR